MLKFMTAFVLADQDFPLFTINLDLPPDQRFKEPSAHFRNEMVLAMKELTQGLPSTVLDVVFEVV